VTKKQFWEHLERSRRKDADAHADRLVKRLAKLPVKEILDFDRLWEEANSAAYTWNMWGAAYIINGGCSDDGFDYFRGWLILRGRKAFEAALKNPDSLAGVVDPDEDFCEYEGRPAWDAWFAATGTDRDSDGGYDALDAALDAHPRKGTAGPGLGRTWDFENDRKMQKRYPRLWALYNAE
jgi:hypothetical protein